MSIQVVAILVSFVYLLWAAMSQYRHGNRRRAKPLIVAMMIFFGTVVNDSMINFGVYQFLYFAEYGFISIVLMMAYSLSNEIVDTMIVREHQKQLEERLRQAQKLEAIGRLAGGIAHDLNNQLTPIVGYSELALRRERSAEELRRFIDQIRVSAEHAKELTWQLLAFGRKQVLDMAVVDLNKVISDSEKMLRHALREDIELSLELGANLSHIHADATQLRQIVMNLVLNARDAMPRGGHLSIRTEDIKADGDPDSLSSPKFGDYVMLVVSDTGAGMDEETKRHVFEPFFTTKTNGEGSGWGLATVYGIVRQHGGNIAVESEQGRGSTFRISFPRTEDPAKPSSGFPVHPADIARGETVLVVEDEKAVRDMVHEVLLSLGLKTLVASRPEEALHLVEQHLGAIHLLLTDVVMPKMNGKELYHRIVEQHPETKVLYMSGYAGDIIAHQGILDDGVSLIAKPFSIAKLVEMVGQVLDLSSGGKHKLA